MNYTVIEDIFDPENTSLGQIPYASHIKMDHNVNQFLPRRIGGRINDRPDIPTERTSGPIPRIPLHSPQYPMKQSPMDFNIEVKNPHELHCRDIFLHVERCPICSAYYKKDAKFYWFIIAILGIIILFLSRDRR